MPAAQGVVKWPTAHPDAAALVEENELPLPDAAVDRVLLVQALEMSQDADGAAARSCGACWRRTDGCLRWCRTGAACGRAWTRRRSVMAGPIRARRSRSLLRETWFTPVAGARRSTCRRSRAAGSCARRCAWERIGATLSAPFAGVHIVEATKQVYRAMPARREKRALVPALQPALAPSPGGGAERRASHPEMKRPGDAPGHFAMLR